MSKYVLTRPCFLDLIYRGLLLACQRWALGPACAFQGLHRKTQARAP